MSYYGYPNPGAYNYQAYAAYAGATFDQYQAAAAYNAAAYRAMQQPPLPPGPPPPPSGQPLTPVPGAGVIGQQKPPGISISQPAQRYDYPPGGNNGNKNKQPVPSPYGYAANYNKTNDVIAAGYAQSMMNVPAPNQNAHMRPPPPPQQQPNMRPPQPNANFQNNNNNNRNWTPGFSHTNATMTNNNANNRRPGLGFNNNNNNQQQQGFKNRRPPTQMQQHHQHQQHQQNGGVKPQLAFYCEICKISCAGSQTYKEHTEGQKHKKREQALKLNEQQLQQQQQQQTQAALNTSQEVQPTLAKDGVKPVVLTATTPSRNVHSVRCELCDVACSGRDSYLSHIRGSKHLKTLKLHKSLGKPIPPDFLDLPPQAAVSAQPKPPLNEPVVAAETPAADPVPPMICDEKSQVNGSGAADAAAKLLAMSDDESVEPIGKEYVETRVDGKAVSFYCKLCDCQFNDPNAKEMHTKGRRHRLSYKKKVDPSLVVDLKGSRDSRTKQPLVRDPRQPVKRLTKPGEVVDQVNASLTNLNGPIQPLMSSDMMIQPAQPVLNNTPVAPIMSQPLSASPRASNPKSLVTLNPRTGESFDDRHIIAKHCAIFPSELEASKIQEIVSNSEKALKLVSDQIAEEDHAKATAQEAADTAGKREDIQAFRALKGVMRVGLFSKNLMLKDDTDVQLVVLCAKKPTKSLLSRVHQILIKKIESVAPQINYSVILDKDAETILIVKTNINALQPLVTCRIMLTSASVRTDAEQARSAEIAAESSDNQEDLLDRRKCLDSLAALRHTKWFQAKASPLANCVLIIRILRDLCKRDPVWKPFSGWALELLVERSLSSQNQILSPGESLRRVLECISTGILLPGGPGLFDPCEKEPTDVLESVPLQVRENVTESAQMLLRQLAFKSIYKILDMDSLNQYQQNINERTARKRQLPTNDSNDSTDPKKVRNDPVSEEVKSENMDLTEPETIGSLGDIFKSENK